jgi:glycosyltransferase involved in cell wall biosynthesis
VHLAVVTPLPPATSGIAQYGYRVAGELARSGVFDRITILTDRAGGAFQSTCDAVTIEGVWRYGGSETGWRIASRIEALKPDLTWFNLGASTFGSTPWSNLSGLVSPALANAAGHATVVTLHEMIEGADLRALGAPRGPLVRWGARMLGLLISRVDAVCVTLRGHANALAARHPHARVAHIPHGLFDDPELLRGAEAAELLTFCHAAPFKGLEPLLEAFRALRARRPELRLTVAGAEHPRFPGYLARLRQAFGDLSGIRWLGYVPEADLRRVFARAAVVVLPYTASTGSSGVLYRAAGWGRPIVMSDLPELRAVAAEESLRVELFRGGDPDSLVNVLARLLADPLRRRSQALHNLEVVARGLTLADTGRAYLRAFEGALDRRALGPRVHPARLVT